MADFRENIPVKSPLALTGVFLDIIRRRFSPDYNLQWKWYPGDEGRQQSTITIEAATNPTAESFGRRPGIYVIRNPVSYNQVALDDLAGHSKKTGKKRFYCMAQSSISFACEADLPAEAELLADTVLSTLLMGSNEIEKAFLFRKLGPFSISSKAFTRQDTDMCRVDVQMGISFDVAWGSSPIAPILKEILVTHGAKTYNSDDAYFVEIYQESLDFNPKQEICDEVGLS